MLAEGGQRTHYGSVPDHGRHRRHALVLGELYVTSRRQYLESRNLGAGF